MLHQTEENRNLPPFPALCHTRRSDTSVYHQAVHPNEILPEKLEELCGTFKNLADREEEDLSGLGFHQGNCSCPEMKRVMCGKMAIAYQNMEIGKGPSNVVYKVGGKAGQQQSSDGSPKHASYKVPQAHHQNDAAAWNIIALGMCLCSPDSNVGLASSPLCSSSSSPSSKFPFTTNSARTSSDGGEKLVSPSCTTTTSTTTTSSRLFSGLGSSSLDGLDHEKRSRSGCSTDSDEEKSTLSHFEGQYGGIRVMQTYGANKDSSRLFGGYQPLGTHMGGPELSSSSSSIGGCDDSSCSSGEGSVEVSSSRDMEVESSRRGGSFNHMESLEASLPIKRGLSRFWNGKAKSFSALADVASIEELAKPDNPYARRRRFTLGERHKSFPPLSRTSTSGISKKPISNSGSRSGLAMAVAMGSKLVQAPNKQQPSPSAYVYSTRSMSLTDLGQGTSDAD